MELIALHPWLLVPAIFLARVTDVTLGTFRSILVFRGHRGPAALTGFFEILLWVLAAGLVLGNLDRWYLAIAYAAGFASGNYLGMWLESRVALGSELVRVLSFGEEKSLASTLRENGHETVEIAGSAGDGHPVQVLLTVERRRRLGQLLEIIHEHAPQAIYTTSDVRKVHSGVKPIEHRPLINAGWRVRGKRK